MSDQQRVKTRSEIIKDLEVVMEIQCRDGNWNYDPYMQGMANGLILAHALALGIEPKYLEAPKQWLKDQPVSSGLPVVSETSTNVLKGDSK